MNEASKRALLYGVASLVLTGIGIVWINTSTEADVMTMLSSADVQLRMAHAIPAVDDQGRPLDKREAMIAAAIEHLDNVESIEPGMAVTAEFRGFAHMLQGQYSEAAVCYRAAQQCPDCQGEQHDVLAFNEARMLAKAGSRERALEVFDRNAASFDRRWGHQRILEEATILRELGRRQDSKSRLDRVIRDDAAPPMARLQAGREYLLLGNLDSAQHALEGLSEELPIADYHLARLKLQQGEVDSCFELLERAQRARPAEVRQMLREEAPAWSAVAQDERFQLLSEPEHASPGR